jgi:hypothetical protein
VALEARREAGKKEGPRRRWQGGTSEKRGAQKVTPDNNSPEGPSPSMASGTTLAPSLHHPNINENVGDLVNLIINFGVSFADWGYN